jgi:hypothetical protein
VQTVRKREIGHFQAGFMAEICGINQTSKSLPNEKDLPYSLPQFCRHQYFEQLLKNKYKHYTIEQCSKYICSI